MSTQFPPFGGPNVSAPWGPVGGAPTAAVWNPPLVRVAVAHAVLWVGLLILLASSGPWSRAIGQALFNDGGYSRTALGAAEVLIYGLLTLPLAVAIVLAGRSVGRVAAALGLVLLSIALGAAPATPVVDSHGAWVTTWVLLTMALAGAWVVARRRNLLGMLTVLIAGFVAFLITLAGDSLIGGSLFINTDELGGLKWGALAIVPLIIASWAAIGIDAATSLRHPSSDVPPTGGPGYPPPATAPQQPWMPS